MKVPFGVCGIGLGHSTRSVALAKRIANLGLDITFFTYGNAGRVLQESGLHTIEIPGFKYAFTDDGMSYLKTVKAYKNAPAVFLERYILQRRHLKQASFVISDGDIALPVFAKKRGLKVVFITNELRFGVSEEIGGRLGEAADSITTKGIGGFFKKFTDLVLVPDIPPPNTVSELASKAPVGVEDRVHFVGPLLDFETKAGRIPKGKGKILLSMGGKLGAGGEGLVYKIVNCALELATSADYEFLMCVGAGVKSAEFGALPDNVEMVEGFIPNSELVDLMEKSDIIVAKGGHSTIMEAMALRKPLISIPIRKQLEQEANARKIKELGVGDYIYPEDLEVEILGEKIDALYKKAKTGEIVKRCEDLVPKNGSETAAELISEFMKGI